MKYIFTLLAVLLINTAFAIDCNKHPIYCSIKSINPNLDNKYVMKLSNVIWKTGVKYNIDRFLIVAIFAQESMFRLNSRNCLYGLLKKTNKEGTVCTDFGIGQIHYMNIRRMNVDVDKLLTDMIYSVDISVRILYTFKKRYSKREEEWWTRYNSPTQANREVYKRLVCRYYKGRSHCDENKEIKDALRKISYNKNISRWY